MDDMRCRAYCLAGGLSAEVRKVRELAAVFPQSAENIGTHTDEYTRFEYTYLVIIEQPFCSDLARL